VERKIIKTNIQKLYAKNYFMNSFGIQISEIHCGSATVALNVVLEKHGNLNGITHGGLIAALADNATGVTGATIGKKVVTSSLHIDYIKGAPIGSRLEATAKILHKDERLLMMSITVHDLKQKALIAKASANMIIISKYPFIPEKW